MISLVIPGMIFQKASVSVIHVFQAVRDGIFERENHVILISSTYLIDED